MPCRPYIWTVGIQRTRDCGLLQKSMALVLESGYCSVAHTVGVVPYCLLFTGSVDVIAFFLLADSTGKCEWGLL